MKPIIGNGRPTKGYRLDGQRIPSVTTIIGNCKSENTSKALMHWAWKLGCEGVNYREVSKAACSAGHLAHDIAEHTVKKLAEIQSARPDDEYQQLVQDAFEWAHKTVLDKTTITDRDVIDRATTAIEGFVDWLEMTRAVVIATEVPLASKKHRFGGTLDAVLQVNDKLCIGDWKTSNSLYPDYLCQIAAYRILWEECYPEHLIDGGFHLIRFDKEFGDFEHRFFRNLDDEEKTFLLMRELYDLNRRIERRVR